MTDQNLKSNNLNQNCACQTFNLAQLKNQLEGHENSELLIEEIISKRPNLFSSTTLFISFSDFLQIQETIRLIEKVLKSKSQSKYFESSGVFMGYDFHLTQEGPRLIEINTNAGGGLLNLELAKAQTQCLESNNLFFNEKNSLEQVHQTFFKMFLNEWKLQRNQQELKVIAIVDENPKEQFLYPEFLLFKELIESNGIKCHICDLNSLEYKDNKLFYQNERIDLVYNRLTDFYLTQLNSTSLLKTYQQNSIVITPSPFHFDTFANKLNLCKLTDSKHLESTGISSAEIEILLKAIPHTVSVNSENADSLWNLRKNYFFKPIIGYGSKAAYRGDKITTRVWEEILKGDYVAQKIAPPSKRLVLQEKNQIELKADLRAYTYEGEIQLMAARLYEGQTTNFRTPGGGFAPVFVID